MNNIKKLKTNYETIMQGYVTAWFIKNKFDNPEDGYYYTFLDDTYNIVEFADYFLSMDDIIYDIDNNIEAGVLLEYNDYVMERALKELPHAVNYSNYVMGFRFPDAKILDSFTIKDKLITLNEYINAERSNRFIAAKLKKENTMLCQLASRSLIGKLDPTAMYDLLIIWNVTNNRQDPDNIYFAVKFILDGIVKNCILKNDGRKNIRHINNEIYTAKEYSITVKLNKVKQ